MSCGVFMEGGSGGALAGGRGAAGRAPTEPGPSGRGWGEPRADTAVRALRVSESRARLLAEVPGAVRLSRCVLRRGPGGLGFPCPAPWWGSWPFPRFRTAALGICCSYFLEYEFVYFQKRTNVELTQWLWVGRFLVEE